MEILIWVGTALAAAGLIGILACVYVVMKARKAALSDEAMRAKLQKVLAWNMGAFMLSAFGLILVVVGIFLA